MILLRKHERIRMIFPLNDIKQGKVIGIQELSDHSTTYTVEPLSVLLKTLAVGRLIRFNSKDVDSKQIQVEPIKDKIKMEDTDLMPFGKFSKQPDGPRKMQNVPASYLMWLHDNAKAGVRKAYPQVFEYIVDNKQVLETELVNTH